MKSTNRASRLLIGAGLAVVLAACSSKVSVGKTTPQYSFEPTCAAAVTVYDSFAQVPASYYEIALITASGNTVWVSDSTLVLRMKEEAAEVGANAIVVDPLSTSATTVQVIGAALGSGDADRKGRAVAIRMPSLMERTLGACAAVGK